MNAGIPLVASSTGVIYYGSDQGLMRSSIAFDHPTVVPGSQGKGINAIAIGATDVWYADGSCLYKAPLL